MALGLPSFGGIGDIVAYVKMEGLAKLSNDIDHMNNKVKSAGMNMDVVLKKGALAGAAAMAALAVASIKAAADFETAMRNVNSISRLSEEAFAAQSQEVINLSKVLPQSATVLAEGLYDIASSGFQGAEGMTVLEASAKAASAGMTTTAVAAKGIVAVLNAYGLGAESAAEISDIMFRTVDKGVITFEQLSATVGDWVGMGKAAGLQFNELSGAIAYMTTKGIGAAEAGTSLQRLITGIVKPSEQMTKVIKQAGFESGEMMLKQKGLAGAMEIVNKATGGSITKLLELLPEIRGVRGANALLGAGYENLEKYLADFNDTSGATNKALSEQSKAFKFQAGIVKNDINAALIELGTIILPVLTEGMKQFGTVIVAILPHLEKMFMATKTLSGPLKNMALLLQVLQPVTNKMQEHTKAMEESKKESAKYQSSLSEMTTAFVGLHGEIGGTNESLVRLATATNDVTDSNNKMNDVLTEAEKNIKLLNDANVSTTKQIKDQIAEYEILIQIAEKEAPHAVLELTTELKKLKDMLSLATGNNKGLNTSLGTSIPIIEKVNNKFKRINIDMEILKSTTLLLAEQFIKLGGGAEVIGIALKAIDFNKTSDGLLKLDISAKSAAQAFEMFANWAIQDAQDALDKFNKLMEDNWQATLDLIQVQKSLYESQQDVYEALGVTTIEMNKLNDELNIYLHRLDDTNITAELFEETLARIAEILARMETISEAWKFDEAFKEMYDTLVGLTEYYAYMVAMYGEGFPGAAAMREQLLAQAQAALALLLTLDPLSAAYAALAAQIQAVEGILGISIAGWQNLAGAISGVLASVLMTVAAISTQTGGGRSREELQDAREGLEGIESALNGVSGAASQFANEWEGLRDTLMGSFDYMNSGMESLRGFVDEMVYMGKPLDSVSDKINSALSEWQAYINTLEPGSQAFEDANAEMQDMIKYLESLGFQVTIDPNALFTGPQGTGGYGGALGEVLDILTGGDDAIIIPVEVDLDLPEEFEDFKRWTDDMKISGHLFGFTMTINWLGENLTHVLEQLGQVTSQTWKIGMKITWDGESLNDTIRKLNTVVGGDMSSGSALAAVTPKPVLQAGAPGSQTNRPAEFNVNISNTLPIQTVVEITDAVIAPRIREIDRKLQPAGSGF